MADKEDKQAGKADKPHRPPSPDQVVKAEASPTERRSTARPPISA